MKNAVTQAPFAPAELAVQHFSDLFAFATDCWDTHEAMQSSVPGFVLVDARSPELFSLGHIRGAVNLPHGKIIAARMTHYPAGTLFVTYCAGPHCNGAARAAIRLARLGYQVKLMEGGICGWLDEGFVLVANDALRKETHA